MGRYIHRVGYEYPINVQALTQDQNKTLDNIWSIIRPIAAQLTIDASLFSSFRVPALFPEKIGDALSVIFIRAYERRTKGGPLFTGTAIDLLMPALNYLNTPYFTVRAFGISDPRYKTLGIQTKAESGTERRGWRFVQMFQGNSNNSVMKFNDLVNYGAANKIRTILPQHYQELDSYIAQAANLIVPDLTRLEIPFEE